MRTLFVASCFLLLAAPLWLAPFRFDKSGFGAHARTAHPFPGIGWDAASWRAFPAAFDAFYADHFRLRGLYMRVFAFDTWHAFRVSPSSKVLVGREGWLYYDAADDGDPIATYQGTNLFSEPELAKARASLIAWRDWLRERGIAFVVCIAPEKTSIYPEFLPAGYATRNRRTRVDQFVAACGGSGGVEIVDLRQPVLRAKGGTALPLYYRTDTHWTSAGAFVGASVLSRALAVHFPGLPPLSSEAFSMAVRPSGPGDLARMIGVETGLNDWNAAYRPRFDSLVAVSNPDRRGALIVAEQPRPGLPRALFFRDSFTEGMIPFLSEEFSRATYVADAQLDPRCILLEKPDVVVLEMVERYVARSLELVPPEEMLRLYDRPFYP